MSLPKRLARLIGWPWCCRPPAAPMGVSATGGGGSMEVQILWDPLPAGASVAHYRLYRRRTSGQFLLLAVVTVDALGMLAPGKLGVIDAPDYWPWPSGADPTAERCYAVSAVSTRGLEGPMSTLVCGQPS